MLQLLSFVSFSSLGSRHCTSWSCDFKVAAQVDGWIIMMCVHAVFVCVCVFLHVWFEIVKLSSLSVMCNHLVHLLFFWKALKCLQVMIFISTLHLLGCTSVYYCTMYFSSSLGDCIHKDVNLSLSVMQVLHTLHAWAAIDTVVYIIAHAATRQVSTDVQLTRSPCNCFTTM